MAVSLTNMRETLLPGLQNLKEVYAAKVFNNFPGWQWDKLFPPVTPPELPVVGPKTMIALGAAALVAKNPVVSRRFWWYPR